MARFSNTTRGRNVTENYEGAKAYTMSPELKLYSAVCTSMLAPKFYESGHGIGKLASLVVDVSPEFVEKLAVYAREQMYLRSVPLVLVCMLAKMGKLHWETVARVIQRADEIYELLACYQMMNNRNGEKKLNRLSNAIKSGIREVFESGKFDEYQFSKYDRDKDVTFRDAIFLSHPKPVNDERKKLFEKIINHELDTAYTWESELSAKGNEPEVWEELIASGRLPYMAMLRNLRNMLNVDVGDAMNKVCDFISDEKQVEKSRQLPFRFLTAYYQLGDNSNPKVRKVLKALEQAAKHSVRNIPGFTPGTKTLIACDVSGSMKHPVSSQSVVEYYDIGLFLGSALSSRCEEVVTGIFGDSWKVVNVMGDNILADTRQFQKHANSVGFSTNGWKVLDWALKKDALFDKVFFFTDGQLWNTIGDFGLDTVLADYRKKINPDVKVYLFDLAGYGTTPLDIRQKDTYFVSGWSDKVFNVLDSLEGGDNAVDVIKRISI